MKKIVPLIFTILLSTGLNLTTAKASQLVAIDLSLICLGGNDYMATFVYYRDCEGVAAPAFISLGFECTGNPANNFTITNIPQLSGTGQEITKSCLAMPTKCAGGTLYGVYEHIYQIQVTLLPCNKWKVIWPGTGNYCCRGLSNTISNPVLQGAYIEATLNNLDAPSNSTPVFINRPFTVLCSGQTQCFNPAAVDIDGDSLVYSMVTPFSGNGTYVTWLPPYSATQPFPSNPPISIDPSTGDICMSPTMNIVSPIGIKVEQWRIINGQPVLLGEIYRDFQVRVITCNNQIPKLSGMDTTMVKGYDPNDTIHTMSVCAGDTVQFTIWGYDADSTPGVGSPSEPHKFSITWNSGIPWGTFSALYDNTDSARATFFWKPNAGNISKVPICFTATVSDGACPYSGSQTYAYCIIVNGLKINIGPDTLLCSGETVTFNAVGDSSTVNYIWNLNGMPGGVPNTSTNYTLNTNSLTPGIHTVSIETNAGGAFPGCHGYDTAFVHLVTVPNPILGNDTVIYGNQPLTLDAGPGAMYLWNTGDSTQQITTDTTGFYKVVVDGGYGTRCTGSDSINVQFIVGIDDPETDLHSSIWPNPSDGSLNIGFNQPCEPGTIISVFNAEGRCVMKNIPVEPGSLQYSLRVNNLPDGLYMLKILTEKESSTHRFVLAKSN